MADAISSLGTVPETHDVFHVYHLRRSGGHGVIAWLLGHHRQEKVHYNQCRIEPDSGSTVTYKNMIARYPGTVDRAPFELASFEEQHLKRFESLRRRRGSGVFMLRDPFNLFASRLQLIRKHDPADPERHIAGNQINANLWKHYALSFVNPQVLPHAIRLDFNRWYTDRDYREHISESLGWPFTDEGFGSRLGWQFSQGSSFGEKDPGRLGVLERWQVFRDDPEFLSLFDDEMLDLAKLIFDYVPDLPWTHRKRPGAMPCVVRKNMTMTEALDLAVDLQRRGRHVEAIRIFADLATHGHQVGKVTNLQGASLLALGRTDEAREVFESSLAMAPDDEESYDGYARALERRGEIDLAISVCRRGLEQLPESLTLHRRMGHYLLLAKNYADAIRHLRFVTHREPTAHQELARLARAYFFQGDQAQAVSYGATVLAEKDRLAMERFSFLPPPEPSHLEPLERYHPRSSRLVIAFSLCADTPAALNGAVRNAELVDATYPDWVARFYCARSTPLAVLEQLQRLGSQVYVMPDGPHFPREAWHFLVADDASLERFICRNCEARLNRRGKAAVDDWIAAGQSFHIMRDAILHLDLILPGMWGGVIGMLPNMQALLEQFFANGSTATVRDFLSDQLWPLVRYDSLIHDTFYRFRGKPFPEGSELESPLHVGALAASPPKATARPD
jgi:tetratricopeptide (TPR) repeat protein